ncbi:hypothetical protein DERP_009176 [Dermatophagoides pteronyssinus]|uniref:Uncharacterized protein n=1 Tax=Dermatophagoides pteronyssinus TaxID=6956 RepID=A0ABQ8JRC7_DERPT|nr:hypothetical protein DERP_009176 [Dermatophagoides pteronyssinus]
MTTCEKQREQPVRCSTFFLTSWMSSFSTTKKKSICSTNEKNSSDSKYNPNVVNKYLYNTA